MQTSADWNTVSESILQHSRPKKSCARLLISVLQLVTSVFSLAYGIFQYLEIDFRHPLALIIINSLSILLLLFYR